MFIIVELYCNFEGLKKAPNTCKINEKKFIRSILKKKNAEMFSNAAENVYDSLGYSFMFTISEHFPISSGNHPEKEQSKTIENTRLPNFTETFLK